MKIKIAAISAIISLVLLTAPTFAKGAPSPFPTPRHSLTQASLRSCEAREAAVKNRMESLLKLAMNMQEKFDAIAQRVEDFYTTTVVPSGKTVPNYDTLVADIAAKKAIVTTDLDVAQVSVNAFSCTGDDPRGLLTSFRLDMQKVKTDLKDFRTTIKNLIVAVKPLAPEATEKPEATELPKPTETP
ncbi:MAG TPA: hypothetical protein VKC54_02535 [Patescibacteria group bacterium]|nr:hypothetical protein [Patescibacteria group bacterium]